MSAAADHLAPVKARLLRAFLRRRSWSWLLPLLPVAMFALAPASHPAAAFVLAVLLAIWIAVDYRQWQQRIERKTATWLNDAIPALEDSSTLLSDDAQSHHTPLAALQRNRVLARLRDAADDATLHSIVRSKVRHNAIPFALALVASGAAWAIGYAHSPQYAQRVAEQQKASAVAHATLTLRAEPPAYTRVPASEGAPRDLQLPQAAAVRWCAANADDTVELSDGQNLEVKKDQCVTWRATESLFWRAQSDRNRRFNIRVTPDQAPTIAISAPTEPVHVLKRDVHSVKIAVQASDDYAIVNATMHLTLARGSGENIRFSDKEVPLPASSDPRTRNWSKEWQLTDLGMEPGDELYFFVRATDNAPDAPHTTQSPTYTLRLPGPEGESLESTALPSMVKPENLRSQRQIIIDTEQLVADAPKLSAAALRQRSEQIASDQAKLRLRYGQFLGEESSLFGDEDHDHEEHAGGHESKAIGGGEAAIIAQFGHAHDMEDNATIFDPQTKAVLRRALSAMWDAEKALRAITPKPALPPEYKALDAIKELQQAERIYLHRTAFVPPAIKEEKRMSGDMAGAQSYRRAQAEASQIVPPEVRELVQALAGEGALPALWSKTAREAVSHLPDEDQRLAAQRAVQDVADGCASCRGALRAWLRATVTQASVVLQARPRSDSAFGRALRKEGP